MAATITKGNWTLAKNKLAEKFAHLNEDNAKFFEDIEHELMARIQRRKARGKIERPAN